MNKIIILLIITSTLFSCSKKEDDLPITIQGNYLVLEAPSNLTKYVYIDGKKLSLLGEIGYYATRSRQDMPYTMINDAELTIYSNTYSVSWDGNKLTLDGGATGGKYVLITESTTPIAEEWITTVDPEVMLQQSSFTNGRIEDMTYYNGYVYSDGHRDLLDNYVITKISPENGTFVDIPIAPANTVTLGYEDNIEYVGSNEFWVYEWGNPNDYMYEFDASNFNKTNTVQMPYQFGYVYHLGSNETELWGSFYADIRKYDFVGQQWGSKIDLGVQLLDGLDVDADYLYISGNGIIHKYSLNPFKAVAAYNISKNNTYRLKGFTLTYGNQIIASAYNYTTKKYEIVRIMLP